MAATKGWSTTERGTLISKKKFQLNQHQRIEVSPLMMYEKLSMTRFQYRIISTLQQKAKFINEENPRQAGHRSLGTSRDHYE